jgi:hypothetical protein
MHSDVEVRHGTYFDHLDAVRERLAWCKEQAEGSKGKRKKRLTAQQTGKQHAKSSLALSYANKPAAAVVAEDIFDSSGGEGEGAGSDPELQMLTESSQRAGTRSASTHSNSTLRSANKKRRLDL